MNFRDTVGHATETAPTGAVGTATSVVKYLKQLVTNTYRLAETADGTDVYPASVAQDSLFAKMLGKGDPALASSFNNTTDSLEAIADNLDVIDHGSVGSGDVNIIYPDVDQPASAIEYSLAELTDDFIADVEITAVGQIDIYRFRLGTDAGWTQIVNAGAMSGTALGSINYSYTFPNASWAVGDMVQVHITGVQVTVNAHVFTMPRKTIYGVVGFNQLLQNMHKLVAVADGAGDFPASVVDGSILSKFLSKVAGGDTSSYDETTDSLEMLSDKLGAYTGDGGASADDSVKAELDLIHTDVDGILADTGTDGVVVNSYTAAASRVAGRPQVLAVSVTSAASFGDVTLATVTTQPCVIDSIVIHADAAQTADLTTCGVFGGASKVVTFIAAADATQADLDAADKQVGWTGVARLAATKTIVITLVGGGATPVDLTVTITYHAEVSGGYLA